MASCLLVSMLTTPVNTTAQANCITYKVQKGDTLGRIAKEFKSTVTVLAKINQLENENRIQIGDILIIPTSAKATYALQNTTSLSYMVSKNDTLTKIANRFKMTVEELKEINHIKNQDVIYEGQILSLERKNYETEKEHNYTHSFSGTYIVQKGDTLAKITQKLWKENYGTQLQHYLGLSDNEAKNIQIGTVLNIPSLTTLLNFEVTGKKEDTSYENSSNKNDFVIDGIAYHVVQKKENLTKIVCYYYRPSFVQNNNIVERVAEYNGIDKNFIKENDIIRIPLNYTNDYTRQKTLHID